MTRQNITEWVDFKRQWIETAHGKLWVRSAGEGPCLVLLHGFPQTGHVFRKIAPELSRHYRVVVPDLPGYGQSLGAEPAADGAPYDKPSMASDIDQMLRSMSQPRATLIGHDRGARVAYRYALDFPSRVDALVSLDTMPTSVTWEAMDYRSAVDAFHWPLLAQSAELVQPLLAAGSDHLIGHFLTQWAHHPLERDAIDRYLDSFRKASVQAAAAADYRAGLAIDLARDRADIEAGKRIECPILVPYGRHYSGDPDGSEWSCFSDSASFHGLDCGHFLAEESPLELLDILNPFLKQHSGVDT